MTEKTSKFVCQRALEMPPFMVMEVMERAAELERSGRSIVHLEVGEPDFETPEAVVEAGIRAIREGRTHYTHSLGHIEFREAIAAWQHRQYGVEVNPDHIVVSVGSSGALDLVFAALLDHQDEVLLTDPHYACYPNFVCAFGGVPVRLPVTEQDGFQYDPGAVAERLGPRTRAVMLNSPANPTGIVTSPARLSGLVSAVDGRAMIVSDEIYHGLVYQDRAHSILEHCPQDQAVVINGFSKLFAMTGWRLGYAVVPKHLVRPMQKLQQNLFISAPDFAQCAAVAALTDPGAAADVERMRECYDQRRLLMLKRLGEMGLKPLVEPTGAFYVFVSVGQYTSDVYEFAFRILEQAGVAVTPGVDFGPGGEGFIRFSYANSLEQIEEGMLRLKNFLESEVS